MIQCSMNTSEAQAQRLQIKTIHKQMENLAVTGAGLSPWEARELVGIIDEVYFHDPALRQLLPGQMKYSCLQINEPAGKPLKECQMKTVVLTIFDPQDEQQLPYRGKDAAITRRWRSTTVSRPPKITLKSWVFTRICRLKNGKYIRTSRQSSGTIHDMGSTLTHKKMIIEKLFIEQKSVQQVMRETCHSARAIERYIAAFRQILLCYNKGMSLKEICYSVRKTPDLVDQYLFLIAKYKDSGYILERLENLEVKIDSFCERQES